MKVLWVLWAAVALSACRCGPAASCADYVSDAKIGEGVFASVGAPELQRLILLPGDQVARQVFTREGHAYEVTYAIVSRSEGAGR